LRVRLAGGEARSVVLRVRKCAIATVSAMNERLREREIHSRDE
jgi:hypothetical protein